MFARSTSTRTRIRCTGISSTGGRGCSAAESRSSGTSQVPRRQGRKVVALRADRYARASARISPRCSSARRRGAAPFPPTDADGRHYRRAISPHSRAATCARGTRLRSAAARSSSTTSSSSSTDRDDRAAVLSARRRTGCASYGRSASRPAISPATRQRADACFGDRGRKRMFT